MSLAAVSDTAGRLLLLGPAAWQTGARLLPFAPERAYQVLAWLGHHGEWVGRERLAALLWPDHDAASARRNLRKVLYRTRGLEGLPAVQERGSMLRWEVPCDVREFEIAADAGQWARAATLWRGEPWQDLRAETLGDLGEWLGFERARLLTRWRHAALRAAQLALAGNSGAAEAMALAQRLLAADPQDEQALRMQASAQALLRDTMPGEVAAGGRAATPAADPRPSIDAAAGTAATCVDTEAWAGDFIGRRAELVELREALGDQACRWITIVGPGGIGKTRLLARALETSAAESGCPTSWVPFHDMADDLPAVDAPGAAEHLGRRLAERLGLVLDTDTPLAAQWVRQFAGRRLRLGLDNLEQLPLAARALAAMLATTPGVQVVASSRARLDIPGERLLHLQGLPWPGTEDAERAGAFDAVQLFARRAAQHRAGFDLATEASAVTALCEAVEGLPLALELAAVWTRHFSTAEIVAELHASAGELLAEAPGAGLARPERQRGMRACFEHSFRRLDEAERTVLEAFSVFRGSFSLDAARQVGNATLPVLASLIDKSLLRRADESAGERRFSLHPLIQQFAAMQLDRDGARAARAHDRMSTYYLRLLAALPASTRPREHQAGLRALAREAENLLPAWERACVRGRGELLAAALPALRALQHLRARWGEGLALIERAEALWQGDVLAEAHAALSRAHHAYSLGRFAEAARGAETMLPIWRRLGDALSLRQALMIASQGRQHQGDYAAATDLMEQGLESARGEADLAGMAAFLTALASLDFHHGRFAQCTLRGREAVQLLRATGGDPSTVLGKLSMNLMADGRLEEALQAVDEALADCPPQAHLHRHVTLLLCAGLVHCRRRDWLAAETRALQADALLGAARPARLRYFVELLHARVAAGRGQGADAHARLVALTDFCLAWGSRPAQATLAGEWGLWHLAQGDAVRGRALLQSVLTCPDLDAGERHDILARLGEDSRAGLSAPDQASAADLLRQAVAMRDPRIATPADSPGG